MSSRLQRSFAAGSADGPTITCTSPLPTRALRQLFACPSAFASENEQAGNSFGYVTMPSDPIANVSIGVPRRSGFSSSTWKSKLSAAGIGFELVACPGVGLPPPTL